MYLLQAANETVTNWTGPVFQSIILVIVVYGIGLFIFYLVIRAAIKSGTAHLRTQTRIANQLQAEDLRLKGVPDQRIDEILNPGRR